MQCLEDSLKVLWGHRTKLAAQSPMENFIPRAIVLAGPTSCGKSDLGLTLAQRLGGEIISADSMQVYRGMNVGTAKPSLRHQELIPHHLIDICDVRQTYNACRFAEDAKRAILSAASRNRVPILVGGTGFYLNSLLLGPPQVPPSDPHVRSQLEAHWEKFGADLAFANLREKDPEYAAKISRGDKHKILRGLEIMSMTGQKVSAFPWPAKRRNSPIEFHRFFLHRPRFSLYRRIEQRCEIMIRRGLLEEVSALIQEGLLENRSASQAIGYRQALDFLKAPQTNEAFLRFRDDFKKASRHYAKRQFTWFRRCADFQWIDLEKTGEDVACEIIAEEYSAYMRD